MSLPVAWWKCDIWLHFCGTTSRPFLFHARNKNGKEPILWAISRRKRLKTCWILTLFWSFSRRNVMFSPNIEGNRSSLVFLAPKLREQKLYRPIIAGRQPFHHASLPVLCIADTAHYSTLTEQPVPATSLCWSPWILPWKAIAVNEFQVIATVGKIVTCSS